MQRKLLAYLLVSSVLLGACVSQEPVLTSTSPRAIQTITPTSFVTRTVGQATEASPLPTLTLPASIAVNQFPLKQITDGITIELTGYAQKDDLLIIEFCFSSPTDETWLFDELIFTLDSHEISPKEQRYNSGRADGISCGSLSFPIDQNIKSGKVELVIGQLQTDVIHYDCVKAQRKLDEAQPDLIVKVHCFSTEDGEGMRIETIKKPENMSAEEVADLVRDAFSDVIEVDLRFSFRIENP